MDFDNSAYSRRLQEQEIMLSLTELNRIGSSENIHKPGGRTSSTTSTILYHHSTSITPQPHLTDHAKTTAHFSRCISSPASSYFRPPHSASAMPAASLAKVAPTAQAPGAWWRNSAMTTIVSTWQGSALSASPMTAVQPTPRLGRVPNAAESGTTSPPLPHVARTSMSLVDRQIEVLHQAAFVSSSWRPPHSHDHAQKQFQVAFKG